MTGHVTKRQGIYGATDTVNITLSAAGATAYSVRSFDGTVITSGSVSGTSLAIAPPGGTWAYGWYRIYLTGSNDATFGTAKGNSNFVVLRSNANFVPNPAKSVYGGSDGTTDIDLVTRGVANIGPYRWFITNADAPTTGGGKISVIQAGRAIERTYWDASGYLDSARPRTPFVAFINRTWDAITLRDSGNTVDTFTIYAATDLIDGGTVFVQSSAGTTANTTKIQVFSPNSSTLVETWDNIPATLGSVDRITSSYIKVFGTNNTATNLASGPTAIGNSYRTGIGQAVTALYPDITRFEGPSNEPNGSAEVVHRMRMFYGAVKAANSSAKVIGYSQVAINGQSILPVILANGGGAWIDEFSFHDYNTATGGDLALMRRSYDNMVTTLTQYGQQNKPRWMTECGFFLPVYGVFHPRRARWQIANDLFRERYGVPRERHFHFYDASHGFWAFPSWFANSNQSLLPTVPLWRVLSEETFGMTYTSAYDFGTPGNSIYAGQRYDGASGGVAVFWSASPLEVNQVILNVSGVSSLSVIDAWGNSSTVTVTGGKATIPTSDLPTYVRIPTAATVTVRSFGTWPALGTTRLGEQLGAVNTQKTSTGSLQLVDQISNGSWENNYYQDGGDSYRDTGAPPATATVSFPTAARLDRVVIWSGLCWQGSSTMLDFDLQTLDANGTSWTTQATRNYTAECTSFLHGSDSTDMGCQRETYWPERWIFDLPLAAPVTTKGVRVVCRQTSYGGEPDAACIASGGQGSAGVQQLTIQEIGCYSDEIATRTRFATLT